MMPIIQLQLSASWKYIRKMMKVKEENEKSTRKHVKSQEGFHRIMKCMREFADPGTAGDIIPGQVFRVLSDWSDWSDSRAIRSVRRPIRSVRRPIPA